MCRIEGVAIGPDAASLDRAAKPIGARAIARPNAGAETIERIIGDGECVVIILEGRHREDRPENLLLEDAHLVMTFEHRRLHIEAAGEVRPNVGTSAARQYFRAFLTANIEIGEDLLELIVRGLCANHG